MFYFGTIVRNILRHKTKSIINIGVCIFVVLLLNIYLGNIVSNRKQLETLPDALPIYCRIVNLNGTQESGLEISEVLLNELQASPQVKDVKYTNTLMAGEGYFELEDWKTNLNINLVGANSLLAIPGLTEELVTIKEGKDAGFLQSSLPYCIVDEELMKEKNWKVGDEIKLNLYYYTHLNSYQVDVKELELLNFEIVGTIEAFIGDTGNFGLQPSIVIPFETVRESYHRMGIPFSADSASFYVANPLKLNEFKKEMHSFGLLSKAPTADQDYKGNTLVVRDSTFISAASKLQQGNDILLGFLPVVFVTVIFIGYIASTLIMDSRQKEFSLMRSLGITFKMCFMILFVEQLFLVLAGELIGCILSYGISIANSGVKIVVGSVFLITYMLGSAVALWRFGNRSVMEALFQID